MPRSVGCVRLRGPYKQVFPNVSSPEDFIWSANVSRRHLTDDQRGILSSKWADAIREAAKERVKTTQAKPGQKVGTNKAAENPPPPRKKNPTRRAIAERAQVSEHKAKQAEFVHKNAPELEEKIIAGDMSLREAFL